MSDTNQEGQNGQQGGTVLVSGSSGLVGRALTRRLADQGRGVTRLVRRQAGPGEVSWDPAAGRLDEGSIRADAVVHLAGENIASGRWTAARMQAIRSSRVDGTRLLCEALARLDPKPSVLVSASAIGFYGDRGSEVLTEDAAAGTGFLPAVCEQWERATEAAESAGIRVVRLRIGVVLARDGGALAKMLLPFKLGLGGRLGPGSQFMSWILLDDLVSAIVHCIDQRELRGAVNATAPDPVTNLQFTKALGRVLRRPTIAPMPSFAARAAFGRMADELLLASTRVEPRALLEHGFEFAQPDLEGALRTLL